jgi:hypothetical protein
VSGRRKVPPVLPSELELEVAWLVGEGFVSPLPGGLVDVTQDGRDFMLWSVWQALGRPGMPAADAEQEATT